MEIWNIILAAGDGTRLQPLTRLLHGDGRPKQFAVLRGERSMLQETITRMTSTAPFDRTVVVVADKHIALAREQLAPYAGVHIVPQPRNVGTAPGILLPLARVMARSPEAMVVITPSDHYFSRPERFIGKLPYAARAARATESGVSILAVEASEPSTELGWIVRGDPLPTRPGASTVRRFVEKPDAVTATALHWAGALWNTFVMVGRAVDFWRISAKALPRQVGQFERYRATIGGPSEETALARLYGELQAADFAAHVLTRADGLAVVPVGGSGWSDWGTPERLRQSLRGSGELEALDGRLAARRQASPDHSPPSVLAA